MKEKLTILILVILTLSSCSIKFNKTENIWMSEVKKIKWIYFDKTDENWKDEYWICHTCTPENWFTKDGWELDETWDYPVYNFADNRKCEKIAYEKWRCIKWWFKITWYSNEKEIFCAITGWKVISWINECKINSETKTLYEYFNNYFIEVKKDIPPLELIVANKKNTDLSAEITLNNCVDLVKKETYITYSCDALINEIFVNNTDKNLKNWDTVNYRKFREIYNWFESSSMNNKKKLVSVDFKNLEWKKFIIEPDVAFWFDYSDELKELYLKK